MNIVISSGHGLKIRGAEDILDEVDEARKVVERVAELLRKAGVDVVTFHDNTSTDQSTNLETIVDFHNKHIRSLDVSIHFNAYEHTTKAMGTECLYLTQSRLAEDVSAAIADAGDLIDRGPKYRSDLYFLNQCDQPAILVETAFVDSETDAELYRSHFDTICQAIAEIIGVVDLTDEDLELDEPIAPPKSEPPPLTEENRVDIVGAVQGHVAVVINGKLIKGAHNYANVVAMQITMQGDVTVSINGQDFHNARPEDRIPSNQCKITATVFGGESDRNYSAYEPYDENGNGELLNDDDYYVALPDRFEGERPNVQVFNRVTGAMATATIEDIGPWNTNDPYWSTGTRPAAESGTDEKGRETNGAGIDLSPALAERLGIDGIGEVDWTFAND